ncbi:NfeD family protein [Aerococcus urinaeequi]|uniref:NfeD family protein n=1 Tax=Aerococcus urinaeequi TaxID=51665 RepID=A0AAF0BJF5_9LACT|nr:NfeD family protein [Aerococcus urinaeequi]WCG37141.1 NfeD family protein [Aerococcus urinaeequi]
METVLFSIGILAIIAGMMTRHYMLGGIVVAGSFLLYFGLYDNGSWLSLMLFALGTVLIISEVFLPTYGILGVVGLLIGAWGLMGQTADIGDAVVDLTIGVVVGIVAFYILVKLGYSIPFNDQIVLNTSLNRERGYQSQSVSVADYVSQEAMTLTPLRPTGKATFSDGNILEVMSDNEVIGSDEQVVVVRIRNNQLLVRRVNHE